VTKTLAQIAVSLGCGILFGFGLALSGMLDPTKVRGFLDIFGHWDPSLAFVLAGAVVVSTLGYRLSRRWDKPGLAPRYELPANRRIDAPLVIGAAVFGVGWGLSGLCPGPAIASLSLGLVPSFVFVAAMIAGMALNDVLALSTAEKSVEPRNNELKATRHV
jgi:uncharacterized membrane protein YedE/YeeE